MELLALKGRYSCGKIGAVRCGLDGQAPEDASQTSVLLQPVLHIEETVVNSHSKLVGSKCERKRRGAYRSVPGREQVVVAPEVDYVATG